MPVLVGGGEVRRFERRLRLGNGCNMSALVVR
jgi:hypothetical protein